MNLQSKIAHLQETIFSLKEELLQMGELFLLQKKELEELGDLCLAQKEELIKKSEESEYSSIVPPKFYDAPQI